MGLGEERITVFFQIGRSLLEEAGNMLVMELPFEVVVRKFSPSLELFRERKVFSLLEVVIKAEVEPVVGHAGKALGVGEKIMEMAVVKIAVDFFDFPLGDIKEREEIVEGGGNFGVKES